jgi:beta-alanine degradation protein BauB
MNIVKFIRLLPLAYCNLLQCEELLPTQTHRVFQFENEHVRVWKTTIMPHQPLKMHRHDCARVVVGLKGGTLTKIEETGETSELNFESGVAYWLTEDPPGTLHADINESDEPIEVMVIELKALDMNKLILNIP